MKRILPAGERYGLKLLYKSIIHLFLLLIFSIDSFSIIPAHARQIKITKLSTADRLPDEFWNYSFKFYHNGHIISKTLKEYKGKPIILDFWSVYCGACIQNIPNLKYLQSLFPEKLSIILVNSYERENEKIIKNFFVNRDSNYQIPTIFEDKILKQYFPHGPIPHYVWITSDGKVDAFTRKEYITLYNIKLLLRDNEIK